MVWTARRSISWGVLVVWSVACSVEPKDSQAETQSATEAATHTGGFAGNCVAAVTEEECSAAVPEDGDIPSCTWFSAYAVTGDGTSCAFEPAGGVCGEVGIGGTGCNHDVTRCGMVVAKTDDMGNTILARISEPASCAFTYDQAFELCYGPQDASTSGSSSSSGDADTNICECACADDWPG